MGSFPPFSSVLKSRAVEDPVNLWVHRPLAYGIARSLYPTAITPNQVTLLSLLVGLAAAACWFIGTPAMMVWGGILLWSSAILDGVDGILARAKRMTSAVGRALDGTADLVVAGVSLVAALFHLWMTHGDPMHLWLVPLAVGLSILHVYLYDFYKEWYLQIERPGWNGVAEQVAEVEARLANLKSEGAHWAVIVSAALYRDLILAQTRVISLVNPAATRERLRFTVNEDVRAVYQRYNRGPMMLWAFLSLAPHTYVISVCAMFDRLDIYLWIRLLGANAMFVVALIWQRIASNRTLRAFEAIGATPIALEATGA